MKSPPPAEVYSRLIHNNCKNLWPDVSTIHSCQTNPYMVNLKPPYIYRLLHDQAVAVLWFENQHVKADKMCNPGFILLFRSGVVLQRREACTVL